VRKTVLNIKTLNIVDDLRVQITLFHERLDVWARKIGNVCLYFRGYTV